MYAEKCEVLVIGAGPAGLAAASCCAHEGFKVLVVDSGDSIDKRDRLDPFHLIQGVGGAGLFSDGKLSYYPSSHSLWALPAKHILEAGFNWVHMLMSDLVDEKPNFPKIKFSHRWHHSPSKSEFKNKKYASVQLSQEQSIELAYRLSLPIKHRVKLNSKVVKISGSNSSYIVDVDENDSAYQIETEQIIFAGGRFGAKKLLELLPDLKTTFRRFEFGVRIEQPESDFFLKDFDTIDTKLISRSENGTIEWRTFCCCRDGKVIRTSGNDLPTTFSGTTWEKSSFSNIGFNTRLLDPGIVAENAEEVNALLNGDVQPFSLPLADFIDKSTAGVLDGVLGDFLREGLLRLSQQYSLEGAMIHGPCIEGTGYYPRLSANLETQMKGVYVAGDSTGIFRGLLPSLLSGYYVAKNACMRKHTAEEQVKSGVTIKRSSIKTMPMIFTAQSKKFFYCRDAICEFVFKQNNLPINPFRVFDYFLSDRVPRDMVRRGNNHLVRACDELWVFGPIADGVLFEVIYAMNISKPIRFFTIGNRVDEIKPLTDIKEVQFEPEVHASRQTRKQLLDEIKLAFTTYQDHAPQLELEFD